MNMDFGTVALSSEQEQLYNILNQEILAIGKRLPEPIRNSAGIFLMEYCGWQLGTNFDFFANYYPPSYTILYWMQQKNSNVTETTYRMSIQVQAMAMFLHSLDDHLCDGQLAIDMIKLQLRTESWNHFIDLAEKICSQGNINTNIIYSFTNDYFAGMLAKDPDDLESYLSRFRKQWATWIVAPGLLTLYSYGEDSLEKCREMYQSFGLAWRLMDDIQDWQKDFQASEINSVYYYLPQSLKQMWHNNSQTIKEELAISNYIEREKIFPTILHRITIELEKASRQALGLGLNELAEEYRAMSQFYDE